MQDHRVRAVNHLQCFSITNKISVPQEIQSVLSDTEINNFFMCLVVLFLKCTFH